MPHFLYSEPGHAHANEDAVVARPHPREPSLLLCALADGQGGQSGGGAASRLAVQSSLDEAAKYLPRQLLDPATWRDIVSRADQDVEEDPDAGFTTLIVAGVWSDKIVGASVGDSMAMLVESGGSEVLSERQRKNPPLGSGAAFPVAFEARRSSGSRLVLMSDGVWKFVGEEAVASAVAAARPEDVASTLRAMQAAASGGKLGDDFSIVLVA